MVSRMKERRRIISPRLKSRIMSEAEESGCVVSEIAMKYKISPQLLYSWRSKRRHADKSKAKVKLRKATTAVSFVEAKLERPALGGSSEEAKLPLKKVSLAFDGFSLAIEGSFNTQKLMQLIAILERPC